MLDALESALVVIAGLWILAENKVVYQVRSLSLIIILVNKVASKSFCFFSGIERLERFRCVYFRTTSEVAF